MKGGESQWEGRLRIPRRSLGVREFENGLRIRTSTSLLCEDTGGDVWRGAMALAKYLEEDEPASFVGKRVIELGGGTGLLGLSLALSGAQEVCITDKENTVPLVQKNISENEALLAAKGANARGAVLDWFDATLGESVVKGCPYDLIVVSDVFYEEEIVEPFVQTLRRLFCLSASRRAISDIRGGTGAAPGAGAGAGGGGRGRGGEGGAGGDVFPDMLLCASHRTERIERLFHEAMREWFVVSEITFGAECRQTSLEQA
ncbi:putative methyltransferase-domain-containing protein [Baffinella frigidus]|nr:putative methyltransferase-domain-containing protein [Cryptophyta sp. CCMP2293]